MCFFPPLNIFNTRLLYFCDAVFKFILQGKWVFLQPSEILKKPNV